MTYVSRRARIIVPRWPNESDTDFLFRMRRRCDGRLKRYSSCHDLRGWINDNCIKHEYLLDLMSDGEVTLSPPFELFGRFIPVPLLFKLMQNVKPTTGEENEMRLPVDERENVGSEQRSSRRKRECDFTPDTKDTFRNAPVELTPSREGSSDDDYLDEDNGSRDNVRCGRKSCSRNARKRAESDSKASLLRALWEKDMFEKNLFKSISLLSRAVTKIEKIDCIIRLANEEAEQKRQREIQEAFRRPKRSCSCFSHTPSKALVKDRKEETDKLNDLKRNELLRQISGLRDKLKENQEFRQKINHQLSALQRRRETSPTQINQPYMRDDQSEVQNLQKKMDKLVNERERLLSDMCRVLTCLNNLKKSKTTKTIFRRKKRKFKDHRKTPGQDVCSCCNESSCTEKQHYSDSPSSDDEQRSSSVGCDYSSGDNLEQDDLNCEEGSSLPEELNDCDCDPNGKFKDDRQEKQRRRAPMITESTPEELNDCDCDPNGKFKDDRQEKQKRRAPRNTERTPEELNDCDCDPNGKFKDDRQEKQKRRAPRNTERTPEELNDCDCDPNGKFKDDRQEKQKRRAPRNTERTPEELNDCDCNPNARDRQERQRRRAPTNMNSPPEELMNCYCNLNKKFKDSRQEKQRKTSLNTDSPPGKLTGKLNLDADSSYEDFSEFYLNPRSTKGDPCRPSTSPTTRREKRYASITCYCARKNFQESSAVTSRRVKSEMTMKEIEKTLRNYEQRLRESDGLVYKIEEWKKKLSEAHRWRRNISKMEFERKKQLEDEKEKCNRQINGLLTENCELKRQVRELSNRCREQAKKIQNLKCGVLKARDLECETEELKKELSEYRNCYEHQRKCITKWESVVAVQRKEIENLMNHIRKLTTERLKEKMGSSAKYAQRSRSYSPENPIAENQETVRLKTYEVKYRENGSCCCQDFRQSNVRRKCFAKDCSSTAIRRDDRCS